MMRLDYESKRSGRGSWDKVKLIVGACVSGSAAALGVVIATFAYHGESADGFATGILLCAAGGVALVVFVLAIVDRRSHQ